MKKIILKSIYKKVIYTKNFFLFLNDYKNFKKNNTNRFSLKFKESKPCLKENTQNTKFDAHYTYHTAWAARIISKTKPEKHIDISSLIEFSTILSAFIPVNFYDFRPINLRLSNLNCKQADLSSLEFEDNSIKSLSCMHTVEHIGLGRYGDKINPDGDLKAISELQRVIKPGGYLLFVVPVGKPKIVFNAHRIYSYEQIIKYFSGLDLKEFSLIPDNAKKTGIIKNASPELADKQNYGCGCFWFTKKYDK